MVEFYFSREYGVLWFRIFGRGLALRMPWNRPLFSERAGYQKPMVRYGGWRVFPLKKFPR